jgi:hypothetical protein
MGYRIVTDAISLSIATYMAADWALSSLARSGSTGFDPAEAVAARKGIEDTIGLEEYYRVEEETVER